MKLWRCVKLSKVGHNEQLAGIVKGLSQGHELNLLWHLHLSGNATFGISAVAARISDLEGVRPKNLKEMNV